MLRRVSSRVAAAVMACAVWAASDLALACPVCFVADEKTRWAYLGTTIFLSLLPLAMAGTLFWWIRRRMRELEADEAG